MGIYSENRAEYVIAELACMSNSITIVPVNPKASDVVMAQKII
jgi:long-subunit acyl-CoA synthetase (AMP-forming)